MLPGGCFGGGDTGPPLHVDMHAWPKFGCSYQTGMTNPACDPVLWASLLSGAGCDLTRIWALDAWANGGNGPGEYAGHVPWLHDSNGVFDLDVPNEWYDERLHEYVQAQNARSITVQITVLELYTWSKLKAGELWVPNPDRGPFRRNRNGVRWGDPDDPTFFSLPDEVLAALIARLCTATRGLAVCFEVGNEMPEKPMHARIAAALRSHFTDDWRPDVTINRQEDTPGRYADMHIGQDYDRIVYHGKASLAYLDEDYPREPRFRTFRQFYAAGEYEPARIIMSTDGCRARPTLDPYDWDTLAIVAQDHLRRGFSFEHQSQVKMRPFLEGHLDLQRDFEGNWLRSLRS